MIVYYSGKGYAGLPVELVLFLLLNLTETMEKLTKEYTVNVVDQGQRLDKYLASQLAGEYSRQKVQDYIKEGEVSVDGAVQSVPKFPLQAGSVVVIRVPVLARRLQPEDVDFDVLYHDTDIALVNKPPSLVVHPEVSAALLSEGSPTLAHGLVKRFPELGGEDDLRPGIVHRLDRDTSGLLLVGLTEEGREYLTDLFAARAVHKEYLALVQGVPHELEGEIDFPIGRHPVKKISMAVVADGKEALSRYRVIYASEDGRFSVVAVSIITGRTHQIRVHFSAIGHPIIGDTLYADKGYRVDDGLATPLVALKKKKSMETGEDECMTNVPLPLPKRQMLHAWKLAFPYEPEHILEQTSLVQVADGWFQSTCPPPEDFIQTLESLLHKPLRVVVTGMPGSGKSSFSQCFKAMGVPVFSADACVKELYEAEGDGTRLLAMRFGETYVHEGGVDKKVLGEAMRQSDSLRREVEDMIHPLVYHALEDFWREQTGQPIIVAEIPLYFESEPQPVDYVLGVSCPYETRAERLREKRGWGEDIIEGMERWQLSEEDKMARCDLVVANDGDLSDLQKKAASIVDHLKEKSLLQRKLEIESIVEKWEQQSLLEA